MSKNLVAKKMFPLTADDGGIVNVKKRKEKKRRLGKLLHFSIYLKT